jgi:hypothetical protein
MQETQQLNQSDAFKYMSVMVLPFDFQAPSEQHNPFDFNFEKKLNSDQTYKQDFYTNLAKITVNSKNIVDDKYHWHVKELMSTNNVNDSAILRVFKINPGLLDQDCDLLINNKWLADFKDSSYIVINDYAQIGYFVFAIKMKAEIGVTFNELLQTDFFRFYTNDKNSGAFKYAMMKSDKASGQQVIDKSNKLTFEDIISLELAPICPYIQLRYQKPLLLNLFASTGVNPSNDVNAILYYSLRNQSVVQDSSLNNHIVETGSGVKMCILNEGSAVIDKMFQNDFKSDNYSAFFNKYFPGFIYVLNQREIMLQINQISSKISVANILECNNDIILELNQIKRRIDIYQFKQMFYSVSFYDELALFYSKLQSFMNIDVLLHDNKECLNSIFIILEEDQSSKQALIRKEQDEKQKRRDLWINATLTGIGCLGLFSYFKDLIPFSLDGQINNYLGHFSLLYKLISAIAPFILFIALVRIMRKTDNR